MSSHRTPLYEIKADLFKALAHPVRIRVLELLAEDEERSVGGLLQVMDMESSHLSQHLAVLRRHGVVASERRGSTVWYRLTSDHLVEMLGAARGFLRDHHAQTQLALADTEPDA